MFFYGKPDLLGPRLQFLCLCQECAKLS
jgi:hypothetical protein